MIRLAVKLAILVVLVVLAIGLYHHLAAGVVHAVHSHGLAPALSHLGRDAASRLAKATGSR